jgi:hypothetical protein
MQVEMALFVRVGLDSMGFNESNLGQMIANFLPYVRVASREFSKRRPRLLLGFEHRQGTIGAAAFLSESISKPGRENYETARFHRVKDKMKSVTRHPLRLLGWADFLKLRVQIRILEY